MKKLFLCFVLVFSLSISFNANSRGVLDYFGKKLVGVAFTVVVEAIKNNFNNITGKTDIEKLRKEMKIIARKIPEMKESIDDILIKINSNTTIEEYMKIIKEEEIKLNERIDRNELKIDSNRLMIVDNKSRTDDLYKIIYNLQREMKNLKYIQIETNNSKYKCENNDSIHKASAKGNFLYVKKCLELGVNPNIKERAGWTPMHSAARHGHISIIRLLINNGGMINIPDTTGRTPLDQAEISKNIILISYLESLGATRR